MNNMSYGSIHFLWIVYYSAYVGLEKFTSALLIILNLLEKIHVEYSTLCIIGDLLVCDIVRKYSSWYTEMICIFQAVDSIDYWFPE